MLSDAERARFSGYRRPADRARFLGGRTLLRTAAARYLGADDPSAIAVEARCPDCQAPHGRPTLPGTGISVSITHSHDRVGVALTRSGYVGLDVEHADPAVDFRGLLPQVLSPAERDYPPASEAGFLRLWTRKEAVLKATGQGLRVPFAGVTLSPGEDPEVVDYRGGPRPDGDFALRGLDAGPGYQAALCVIGTRPVRVTSWSALPIADSPRNWGLSADRRRAVA